jgi:hypothetical protein
MAEQRTGGQPPEDSWEKALELCLTEMEEQAAWDLEKGLLQEAREHAAKNFKDRHAEWPQHRATVLHSARQLGSFAKEFAAFDYRINGKPGRVVISKDHLNLALHVVRKLCPAGERPEFLLQWCPDEDMP